MCACAALLLAAQVASAATASNVGMIVPGQGIGPVRIGMTVPQVRVLAESLPCEIAVAYTDGRASRLETNCGVAYQTVEGITVGLDGSRIWWTHGQPDLTVPSSFARTRADWLVYRGAGIGFRVIYAEGGTLIQAISIFRGTGAPAITRPPVPPPAAPPPVVGEYPAVLPYELHLPDGRSRPRPLRIAEKEKWRPWRSRGE